jgi:hypothetical protein
MPANHTDLEKRLWNAADDLFDSQPKPEDGIDGRRRDSVGGQDYEKD